MAGEGHRDVRDRHLPGTHAGVAADEAGHGPVADGDQEALVGDRRQAQQPERGIERLDRGGRERLDGADGVPGLAGQPRRLAEQHVQRQVHRTVAELAVRDDEAAIVGEGAEHGVRAALAPCQRLEVGKAFRGEAEHVALLRLVAPDLQRTQARLRQRNGAQVDASATGAVRDRFRDRVGQPAGADVVDEEDRVLRTERPAAVDHFLGASLHLGVAALHGSKVEARG